MNRYTELFDDLMEIDICIPSKKTAIEYDGTLWHSGKRAEKREKKEYEVCRGYGISLYRIREEGLCSNIMVLF